MSLQIIEWPDFLNADADIKDDGRFSASAMTIGVFDGVHLGHQALIKKIVSIGPNPTVVTFRENPKKLIAPENFMGDIFSLKQKMALFEQMGVCRVILIDFSAEFSKLNGWSFINLLEERGKMAYLAIGSNFRCGFRQNTGAEYIAGMNERKGIPTGIIPQVAVELESGTEPVNSSRIRQALVSGDMRIAAALMGRNFELDIAGIKPVEQVYDIRSARRIVPDGGQYPVIVNPGGINAMADIYDGKLRLEPVMGAESVCSLEFI